MGGILIVFLALIILYNLIINLSNMTIIIKYCLGTNTLDEYWSLYFKHCFSFRAIYSSVFGLFLAILIFVVLIPIVIIRSIMNKGQAKENVSNGMAFEYKENALPAGSSFFSNCNDYGFAINRVNATGKIADDIENVLNAIMDFSKNNNMELKFDFMKEMYIFSKDKTAIAPLVIVNEELNYPVYFLYNDSQIAQFKNVRSELQETRFKDCIYFSVNNF